MYICETSSGRVDGYAVPPPLSDRSEASERTGETISPPWARDHAVVRAWLVHAPVGREGAKRGHSSKGDVGSRGCALGGDPASVRMMWISGDFVLGTGTGKRGGGNGFVRLGGWVHSRCRPAGVGTEIGCVRSWFEVF